MLPPKGCDSAPEVARTFPGHDQRPDGLPAPFGGTSRQWALVPMGENKPSDALSLASSIEIRCSITGGNPQVFLLSSFLLPHCHGASLMSLGDPLFSTFTTGC